MPSLTSTDLAAFGTGIHDLLEGGDEVAARVSSVGPHRGELMGVPARGNEMPVPVFDRFRFRDDTVMAHRGLMDMASLMAQTGAQGAP